jgi:aminoglycoside/choline kinase family phosphotransferase
MKTAGEMLDERLTIQDGLLKGARITISESIAKELMEEYHSQFRQKIEVPDEEESKICYSCNVLI